MQQVADAEKQLEAARKQANVQLEEGRQEIEQGEVEVEVGQKELTESEKKYEEASKRQRNRFLTETIEFRTPKDLRRYWLRCLVSFTRDDNPWLFLVKRRCSPGPTHWPPSFPYFFLLVALLVCLTTMTRMVEEQRGQMGTLKAMG